MKSLKPFFLLVVSALSISIGVAVGVNSSLSNSLIKNAIGTEQQEFEITLDKNNTVDGLTSSSVESISGQVYSKGNYVLSMKYLLAMGDENAHIILNNRGKMYNAPNDTTYNNRITGLRGMKVNFSGGSLYLKTSIRNDGLEYGTKRTLTSGNRENFSDNPYYFMLEAGDSDVTITSVVLYYSCSENEGTYLSELNGTYTGNLDGYIYKLTINGSNGRIESVNKTSNVIYDDLDVSYENGLLTVGDNTISFVATVSNDHYELSATGNSSDMIPSSFFKVYKVEDFESYTATGKGYDNNANKNQYTTTNLRSQFYSQYSGDNVTYYLMGGTDYITYLETGGRGGTKAMNVKVVLNSNNMRYIQNKAWLGDASIIGKGKYLSFWSKSAATTASGTGSNSSYDVPLEVYGFKFSNGTRLNTNANITSSTYRVLGNITVSKGITEWTHYSIPLGDEAENYSAFGIKANKVGTGGTVYLPIDDVEIYTYDPYADPVAFVESVSLDGDDEVVINRDIKLTTTFTPENATNKNVTYTSSNTSVATVSNDGRVRGVSAGEATITITTEDGGKTSTHNITVVEPYIGGTFMTRVYNDQIAIELMFSSTREVITYFYGSKVTNQGITEYNSATGFFKIPMDGSVSIPLVGTKTYGDLTGYYRNNQLENVGLSGTIGSLFGSDNGNFVLEKPTYHWDCNGTDSALQSQFIRRGF